jgi:hypothetical protein
MKLLIGLLAVGIIVVVGGIWFLSRNVVGDEVFAITLMSAPGSYISDSQNQSSQVLLQSITIENGTSEKQYLPGLYVKTTVNAGEKVMVIKGSIKNTHPDNKEITMYAIGYDVTGKEVAGTIDAAHIAGQIGMHLENGETGDFTLHLSYAENIKVIRIFADTFLIPPP